MLMKLKSDSHRLRAVETASSSRERVYESRCAHTRRLVTRARAGRGSSDSRLIIPGGGEKYQRDKQSSRLVMPGQERASKGALIDTSGVNAPSTKQFRPPPGFMDTEPSTQAAQPLDQDEVRTALDRIRSSVGEWHVLAQLVPRLSLAGYDSTAVELETGLERVTQNIWAVAAQVYDTLKKSDKVPSETLSYFGGDPDGANMLYHLRFLPVGARPAVAIYAHQQQLSATECELLARAVKEQERRSGEKEGFTASPADCLAYKYYRDAVETRREYERAGMIKKGLAVAETSEAVAALQKLMEGSVETVVSTADAEQRASLEVIRLTGEEVEFRPVQLAGDLSEASPSAVAGAVRMKQAGPFNAFSMPPGSEGQQFVALPAFRSLLLSRSPVVLGVADCTKVPLLQKAARIVSKPGEQQAGPGLILLERLVAEGERDPKALYVRAKGDACELVEYSSLEAGEEVLGQVLFLCRPPARTASSRLNSHALMSL